MNLTISENVNEILFNGYYVQKLVFNGHEVWSKGVTPSPGVEYINPHVDSEYYYDYTISGQNNTWQNISLSNAYQQFNFVDCTDSSVSLGDPTCDYGDVKILIFCSDTANSKYIPDSSYVGKVKISELIPPAYVTGLRETISNAESTMGVYSNTVRDAILNYYNTILNSDGLYANQIRDGYYTVANFMQKKNSNYTLPTAYLAQPDISVTDANNIKYNIDDNTSGNIQNDTKVRIVLKTSSSEWYYNGANTDYYVCSWYSILIMIYDYYWLRYLNESSITKYSITVSSNNTSYGTVEGGHYYFENSTCTLNATPTSSGQFDGWYENNTLVSTSNPYNFTVTGNRTLQGRFSERTQYTVTVSSEDVAKGTVSGGGTYYEGSEVTLTATPTTGYVIDGWYINNSLVSSSNPYTFTLTGNTTVVCKFAEGAVYTLVSNIYPQSYATYTYSQQYFDTGISPIANVGKSIVMNFKFYIPSNGNDGNVWIGNMGATIGSTNTSKAVRFFGENYFFVDVANGRKYSSTYSWANVRNKTWDVTWTINFTSASAGTFTLVNNSNNSTIYSGSFSSAPADCHIYICMPRMKFYSLSITKNDSLVFDGKAAIDTDNKPCIYDSVTNSLFYAKGNGANYLNYTA